MALKKRTKELLRVFKTRKKNIAGSRTDVLAIKKGLVSRAERRERKSLAEGVRSTRKAFGRKQAINMMPQMSLEKKRSKDK